VGGTRGAADRREPARGARPGDRAPAVCLGAGGGGAPSASRHGGGGGGRREFVGLVWGGGAAERRPHLVTVLGPPGIGKSRLCHEVSELVGASGGRIVRGRWPPHAGQTG